MNVKTKMFGAAYSFLLVLIFSSLYIPFLSNSTLSNSFRSYEHFTMGYTDEYTPHNPIVIVSDEDFASQAAIEGWIGAGTLEEPYIIEGLEIDVQSTCVTISGTTVYFIIRNSSLIGGNSGSGVSLHNVSSAVIEYCYIALKEYGIYGNELGPCSFNNNTIMMGDVITKIGIVLSYSPNCTASHNGIYDGLDNGILLDHSENCDLMRNRIIGMRDIGIELQASPDCKLENNYIYNTEEDAIYIKWSDRVKITNNTLIGRADKFLSGSESGIQINDSDFCVISGNTICGMHSDAVDFFGGAPLHCTIVNNRLFHNYRGVDLQVASTHTVVNNSIFGNSRGIEIGSDEQDNVVFGNEIGWNTQWNAWDDGINNSWDDGIDTGNTWSDYDDSGFYVVGSKGWDHYPSLLVDDSGPFIESNITNDTITWMPTDEYPHRYGIFENDSLIESGHWYGFSISITIDDEYPACMNYSLVVYDAAGNFAANTILVTPPSDNTTVTTTFQTPTEVSTTPTTPSTDNTQLVLILGGVGACVMVAIVLILAKRR